MSFKRRPKSSPPQASSPAHSRLTSAASIKQLDTGVSITSSGIPSLDDVLGGGVALSSVCTILDPNLHSAHGDLILKHFISQGILANHSIALVDLSGPDFLSTCPWTRPSSIPGAKNKDTEDAVRSNEPSDDAVTIAWRYQHLRQFSTTVETEEDAEFCHSLDLSTQIPSQALQSVKESGRCLHITREASAENVFDKVIQRLDRFISSSSAKGCEHYRICIRNLGSLDWGDHSGSDILRFFIQLRALIRDSPNSCAMVKPATQWSSDTLAVQDAWVHKLAWLSDSCITFTSIAGDPTLEGSLPHHHGMLTMHDLQKCNAFTSPSDRHSRLRGLAPLGGGGSGENNLAFKCTRKKVVIETFHLDVEGGVGERRTTRPDIPPFPSSAYDPQSLTRPAVTVELDEDKLSISADAGQPLSKPKTKKGVAFRMDRPDLYDF